MSISELSEAEIRSSIADYEKLMKKNGQPFPDGSYSAGGAWTAAKIHSLQGELKMRGKL